MQVYDDAGAEEGGGVVVGWDKGKGRQGDKVRGDLGTVLVYTSD